MRSQSPSDRGNPRHADAPADAPTLLVSGSREPWNLGNAARGELVAVGLALRGLVGRRSSSSRWLGNFLFITDDHLVGAFNPLGLDGGGTPDGRRLFFGASFARQRRLKIRQQLRPQRRIGLLQVVKQLPSRLGI